jgi:pimeloyl-ACP methyl ester carboxylesterase
MTFVDKGDGPPIVLVPGLQGRWEYMSSTVDALAQSHRVITFSLCDEPGQRGNAGMHGGLEDFVDQIGLALDSRGIAKAAICGVSLGGLISLRFAARRPERTSALVLVSTPGPGWHLKQAHRRYARYPWLLGPLFFAGVPTRLGGEIATAIPNWRERWQFGGRVIRMLLLKPLSPSRMAARARLIDGVDNSADCAAVSAPTLLITGEPALDHVVPADGSCEYARLISGSRTATLKHTGHLGCVTRPKAFASLVGEFLRSVGIASRSSQDAA